MTRPILIIGAGGHGRVIADLARACHRGILGYLDEDRAIHGQRIQGIEVLGGDERLNECPPEQVVLANGIGSVTSVEPRQRVFTRLSAVGYVFEVLVHPSAIVATSVSLSGGAQVMAGAVVQAGTSIAENAILNTGAIIDHDCVIGRHSHVAPGATLCGNVQLGERSFVGAGSTVIQGIRIGNGAFVGAGAVVVSDVEDAARVTGVPAKIMSSR
jgi:sugar O-acyltransferase (sialic acid O-acetyltransferase NeuD family)